MYVNFNFEMQVKIVLASMAIHNYIRMRGSGDATFQIAQEESYIPRNDERHDDGVEPHNEVSSSLSPTVAYKEHIFTGGRGRKRNYVIAFEFYTSREENYAIESGGTAERVSNSNEA
ncbi:unnamed protein product [Lactuca saligna]|uniref:Uncharacterized protein n=1 Tax=Lactuca saligna TaxID=75948 RepID=A0AA35Z2J6_LACSI|nr:unnamed protein product [Lactuca saligna]